MSDRITDFLMKAREVQTETEIETLCEQEIENLYATYATTTVHKEVSLYRNAIQAWNLPLAFLTYFRERKEASEALRADYAHKVGTRHRQQYPITDVDGLLERASTLVESSSYSHLICGLELLTGRRPFEIAVTASFTPGDNEHYVWFQGQAKTRGSRLAEWSYEIPVLTENSAVCDALHRLRQVRSFEGYTSQRFDNVAGKTLRDARRTAYQTLLPEGALQVKEALRKIYACVAYDWFARPDISYNAYLADILGHGPDDVNTANSYQDFYLAKAVE